MSGPSLRASRLVALAAAVVLAGVVTAGCSSSSASSRPLPTGTLTITGASGLVSLRVQIARTAQARQAGLMHRRRLAADAGMAFVFERPTDGPFWMKDTLVPLSVAFWSSRHTIVALLEMTPCRADPCHLYYPHAMYAGAVEANRGFFLFHGITVGDTVVLRG